MISGGTPVLIPLERELQERLAWFIRMRWVAAAGILVGTWIAHIHLVPDLPTVPLYATALVVLFYNLLFLKFRSQFENDQAALKRFVYEQIILDWIALAIIVHFWGGIRSPVTLVFTFHLIIGAILLSPRSCYYLTAAASLLMVVLTLLEGGSLAVSSSLQAIYAESPDPFLGGFWRWLILTVFFLVVTYLATSITAKLREKESALFASEQALDRAYHEMEALHELGKVVNSTLNLEEVLELIAEHAAKLLNMRACFIRLFDKTGTRLYIGGAYGLSQAYLNKGPVEVAKSLIDLEALRGGAIQVLEVAEDSRFQYPEEARKEGLRSMLSVPVKAKSRVLGVIRVYSGQPHTFSDWEQRFLRNLANLGAVAIENARSYAELKNLNDEKVWFARMTHHQLRSPLAAIHGTLDALPYAGPLSPKQQDLTERAKRRIQDAFDIIRDFLDLAAAQRPREKEAIEPVELGEALQRAVESARETARGKDVEFTSKIEPGLMIRVETADLDRIFSNLLENAVKYTPAGGHVEIVAGPFREGFVRVEVSDTGIGIPKDEQERVFEGFYRTREAKATGAVGTGLGLSIVQTLAERIGARLELESEPGKGTRFKVFLPTE